MVRSGQSFAILRPWIALRVVYVAAIQAEVSHAGHPIGVTLVLLEYTF